MTFFMSRISTDMTHQHYTRVMILLWFAGLIHLLPVSQAKNKKKLEYETKNGK